MYVDNMITGVELSPQADALYKDVKNLFQSASTNHREWASNPSEIARTDPRMWSNRCRNYERPMDLPISPPKWAQKREVTTQLGVFSPATLNAKLFIKELFKQKDWDEIFSQSHQQEWNKICESLTPLFSQPLPIGGDECKLFYFTDTSAKAYSVVVYLYY